MSIKFNPKIYRLIIVIIVFVLTGFGLWHYLSRLSPVAFRHYNPIFIPTTTQSMSDSTADQKKGNEQIIASEATTTWRCLKDGETVTYKLNEEGLLGGSVNIKVRTINRFINFSIPNIFITYHPIETHRCGIYLIKVFNYNLDELRQEPGSKVELWKYDYQGKEKREIIFSKINEDGQFIDYYNYDFRVSPDEKYVVLISGGLYDDDHAIIIKDLNSKENVFVLTRKEVIAQSTTTQPLGLFKLKDWTRDGRYFWGTISAAAYVQKFLRIDSKDWHFQVFDAWPPTGNGDALNIETGWVTHHTNMEWFGIYQVLLEEKKSRREKGIGTDFYIYNLFTKEKKLIFHTDEPLWFTEPVWLSDNELQYKMPDGTEKIYKIKD